MWDEWKADRAAKRIRPGDGRPLKRFRWWQLFGRSVFHLPADTGRPAVYSIDVTHAGDKDTGEVMAKLYRDGTHVATSKVPARFPVEGGTIEVAASTVGLKRAHFVTPDGAERQLVPDSASAEGRRARLTREHPAASRALGAVSIFFLVIGVALLALQLLESLSAVPPVAESIGVFVSPVHLPVWLNIALGIAAALGSTERALRLRYHWLLDGAGN